MIRDHGFAFLAGLSAGVTLGVLFAPKSGGEFRNFLAKEARGRADTVKETANDLWDSAQEVVEKGRSGLTRQREGIEAAVKAGTKAYHRAVG